MSETFAASFDDRQSEPEVHQLQMKPGRLEVRRRPGPDGSYRLDRFTVIGAEGRLMSDCLVGFNLQARSSLDLVRDYWPGGQPRRKHSIRLGPAFEVVSLQRQAPDGRLEFSGRVGLNRQTGWLEITSLAYDGQARLLADQSWSSVLQLDSPQKLQTRRPTDATLPLERYDHSTWVGGWPNWPPGLAKSRLGWRSHLKEKPPQNPIALADGSQGFLLGFDRGGPGGRQHSGYVIQNADGFWGSELHTQLEPSTGWSRQLAREFWGHGLLRRESWLQLTAKTETTKFQLLRPDGNRELEVEFEFDRTNGIQQTKTQAYDKKSQPLADRTHHQAVRLTPAAN